MKRIAIALGVAVALTIAGTISGSSALATDSGEFPNYRAAQLARERGDCDAVVEHLNAFLRDHSYVREEKHRKFYLRVLRVLGECDGTITIRGVGDELDGIAPLPEHPPDRG